MQQISRLIFYGFENILIKGRQYNFSGPKLISPPAAGLGSPSALMPGAGFSPSCMSSSGFNLHHFSIMTEQVIVALMSSQLNDETALAIIISKPFVRVVKVEFVVWRLL